MIALVDFLSNDDLAELINNKELLDGTRNAAKAELSKRVEIKFSNNDV